MLAPDFNPAAVAVRIHCIGYMSKCKACGCRTRASIVAEKVDGAGRHVHQVELSDRHAHVVVERERARGLEILDRRDWR